ncbi:hypothetical protein TNCV_3973791 [Trichonephila clavipes]|nr:hypothetical protein TNCV_3973791 [Trichonephila clavipes]
MRKNYPSDISREQFEKIRPILESSRKKTRTRKLDLYEVFCAVLYIVWAKTWRIGCGFTAFFNGNTYTKFYVCNYGPAGNMKKEHMYEQGKPGSACPINSCVGGKTCTGGNDYPGLCKMLDPNTAPVYRRDLKDVLFFCDFSSESKDCAVTTNGTNNWEYASNLQGL